MNIKIVLHEPYLGMVSGWPTRYIGMINELYRRHKLSIFAPGDTQLLKNLFPDAYVCESTSDKAIKSKFSPAKYIFSLIFPKKDNILRPGYYYYPDFDDLVISQKKQGYDIVFFIGIEAINYYCYDDSVPIICDFCDSGLRHLLSSLDARMGFVDKIKIYLEIAYLYRTKRKIVGPNVTILAATEKDSFYIKKVLKKNKVYTIPNGIDVDKIDYSDDYIGNKWKSDSILFCGSLNYEPNARTIRYILQELWAPLKELYPTAKLEIVGRSLPRQLSEFIAGYNGVYVYTDVPDVFKYYKSAKLILSPLFSGGGIKNKFLEALSTATPIVTNHEGAIGIKIESGIHGYIMENKNDLILATEKILKSDFNRYKMLCENCRSLSNKYSWNNIGNELNNVLDRLTGENIHSTT